ncbi:hypothetical protein IMCC26134_09515 [Verrucomicrobia bacterium IMCC26134]|nr:hypothetical protein IMCC26134_09515 [Verrucomicrobia bacterium IMCC26134]
MVKYPDWMIQIEATPRAVYSRDMTDLLNPLTHPFYLVPIAGGWRLYRYKGARDIGHSEYWRQNVALVVAKYTRLPFAALRELPYCLPRGRFVAKCELLPWERRAVLFCGEVLNGAQRKVLKAAYGDIPILPDEHEVRLPADVEAYKTLIRQNSGVV